jgi:hypothetical protein
MSDEQHAGKPSRSWLRRGLLLLVIASPIAALEISSYLLVRSWGWFEGWEYLTIEDPEVGYSLRPGFDGRYNGVEYLVNRSGIRDVGRDRVLGPGAEDEFLVFAVGDSNTMGNSIEYRDSYPARLESTLAARTSRPVRVVNLGVGGHSAVQSLLLTKRWLHLEPQLVIFADSCNNRAFGATETDQTVLRGRFHRPWEFGPRIWYSLLLTMKLRNPPVFQPLVLTEPLPPARVSLEIYRDVLGELVALSEGAGFDLVFLATGEDPEVARPAGVGMGAMRTGDWARAERAFRVLVAKWPNQFLGWYYLHRSYLRTSGRMSAPLLVRQYESSLDGRHDYLENYAAYAADYVALMQSVARSHGLDLVDVSRRFGAEAVEFSDVCHYMVKGHELVAEALAERIDVGSVAD